MWISCGLTLNILDFFKYIRIQVYHTKYSTILDGVDR